MLCDAVRCCVGYRNLLQIIALAEYEALTRRLGATNLFDEVSSLPPAFPFHPSLSLRVLPSFRCLLPSRFPFTPHLALLSANMAMT